MAVLDLRFCARAFSSCGKRGPLFITVRGPLTIAASLVAEHRLQKRRLSNCGSRAHLLRGMWDLPRPGLKPVSPALAGRLSTTAPPGKPKLASFLILKIFYENIWSANLQRISYSWQLLQTTFHLIFFFKIFWCGPFFLKSLLNLLQYYFCFMFCLFGPKACGILAPWPGIEPTPPALEGEVLTTGPPGKPLISCLTALSKIAL